MPRIAYQTRWIVIVSEAHPEADLYDSLEATTWSTVLGQTPEPRHGRTAFEVTSEHLLHSLQPMLRRAKSASRSS